MKIGLRRLLKLADHLEHGKLGHEKFDFRYWNWSENWMVGNALPKSECGTLGCAIGEMPILWPKRFMFRRWNVLNRKTQELNFHAVTEWFEISFDDAAALFSPNVGRWWAAGRLKYKSSREAVARSIREYVAAVEAGKRRPE